MEVMGVSCKDTNSINDSIKYIQMFVYSHHISSVCTYACCTCVVRVRVCTIRENLMPLQFWITLVLALGMLETTVLFGKYLNWNDYGSPAMAVTFVALFFGVLKVSCVWCVV